MVTARETPGRTIERTEHPHIVRDSGIAGGDPIIEGTRIRVEVIARFFEAGAEPSEVLATYPHLEPAAVYDAISYYLDHQREVDRDIAESIPPEMVERYDLGIHPGDKIRFTDS